MNKRENPILPTISWIYFPADWLECKSTKRRRSHLTYWLVWKLGGLAESSTWYPERTHERRGKSPIWGCPKCLHLEMIKRYWRGEPRKKSFKISTFTNKCRARSPHFARSSCIKTTEWTKTKTRGDAPMSWGVWSHISSRRGAWRWRSCQPWEILLNRSYKIRQYRRIEWSWLFSYGIFEINELYLAGIQHDHSK